MEMVLQALKPFVEEICEDRHTAIKVVVFNRNAERFDLPRNRAEAGRLLEQRLRPQGGTDFNEAAKGLVAAASEMLQQHPTFQLTVIMCSDGDVPKENALRGHSHWTEFVRSKYLAAHDIAPYLETIGISADHDADVLSGFIIDDRCGNYVRCTDSAAIREGFRSAQSGAMARCSTKLAVEFPLSVHRGIRMARAKGTGSMHHDVIAVGDEFSSDFWIEAVALDEAVKIADELFLAVNGQRVPIEIVEVTDSARGRLEAIAFYDGILKEMLHSLRELTDAQALRAKAQEIDSALNNEFAAAFAELTAGPPEKRELRQQIASLVSGDKELDDEEFAAVSARRAALMARYKKMQGVWKQQQSAVAPLQSTLRGLKALVREIVVGRVRTQELRQHVLDLHFKKKHESRFSKLVLTDEQLARRQREYSAVAAPRFEDCRDIADEAGSGCFLSTLSRRECVLAAEPLWICGRVDRSGGAQVSNPELIRIEYISADLVSDSYFRMAVEAAAGGEVDALGGKHGANENANVTFCDGSRQRVNCRLFPIYCNLAHYRASSPFFEEAAAHTLSGRCDLRAADYNLPSAVIGAMISRNRLSQHNVRRLLFEVVPSMELFLGNNSTFPFLADAFDRRGDRSLPKAPLTERRRCRLVRYLETFRARTTAWVTTASVLFADRLLNLDVQCDHEFYLSILVQRMRGIFSAQIQEANGVEANHRRILRILVCGAGGAEDECKENAVADGNELRFNTESGGVDFSVLVEAPSVGAMDLDAEYDPNEATPATMRMLSSVWSRIDVRDLLQSKAFFDVLAAMGPAVDAESCSFDKFSSHKHSDYERIPNDLGVLLTELTAMGWKGDAVLVLRAMAAVSIVCASNRAWQRNLHWFGDDALKQLFNDPRAVLRHIHREVVLPRARKEYGPRNEAPRRSRCSASPADDYEIHKNPKLPDEVDEFGNLPRSRCAYSQCGREFADREQLLEHVKRSKNGHLTRHFHRRLKSVLEPNPGMSYGQFLSTARQCWEASRCPAKAMFRAYYDQMQPIFMRNKQ